MTWTDCGGTNSLSAGAIGTWNGTGDRCGCGAMANCGGTETRTNCATFATKINCKN